MRMPAYVLLAALAGCAGHVVDHIGPKSRIVEPEMPRYGLDLRQARCVSNDLANSLSPLQLRLFARAAGSVRQGYFDPDRLTMRDLMHVAASMDDPAVGQALIRAATACDATPEVFARREAPAEPEPDAEPPAPPPPAWLNLGAAPSGQSIAVDASSIEQKGALKSAWFRMTDPGAEGPSEDAYLLSVDCGQRTMNPKARRRHDASGQIVDAVEYPDNPLPVEGGTVMEIAWLALCT